MMKLVLSSFMTCSPIKLSQPIKRDWSEILSKYKWQVAKELFQMLMPLIEIPLWLWNIETEIGNLLG